MDPGGPNVESENQVSGSRGGHITQFWNFGTPLRISGMVEARNSKFGMQVDPRGTKGKMKN